MDDPTPSRIEIYRGSQARCREYSLVLESKALEHDMLHDDGQWGLWVSPEAHPQAVEEIGRYANERHFARPVSRYIEPHGGVGYGVIGFAIVLIATAYGAGGNVFGVDWLRAGALVAGADVRQAVWRAVTALTLHADQAHLLGNLLFGILAGGALSRLVGSGLAWAAIVFAAVLANLIETGIAPPDHHAIGASTAVFAALGLLSGLAWGERIQQRQQNWYRWAPLLVGLSLLSFFGAGAEHVDVLGHLLGFGIGTIFGWVYAQVALEHRYGGRVQAALGACTLIVIVLAWSAALHTDLHALGTAPVGVR